MAVHGVRRQAGRAIAGLVGAVVFAIALVLPPPAVAAAPGQASLVAPGDGAVTTDATPTLQVRATDPDGDPLTVTFEGREADATAPSTAAPFSFVVLPDTQNYTYSGRQGTILRQSEWVVANREALDVAFVAQLGDLVSNWDNPTQWGHVSAGLRPLDVAGIPNSVIPGNHDFNTATGEFPLYDAYFPPTRYSQATWTPTTARYGGYLGQNQFGPDPVDRRNMNNYALFTAGGTDFLMLNLEWEAPSYALEWADRVLAAHPDRTVIMTTHSFLTVGGNRRTTAQRPGGTAVSAIWDSFVSTHCAIRLVVSGHESSGDLGEARRTDTNSCGRPVHSILTDYQGRANGGNGWLRYYTIDPSAGTLVATTYSPTLGLYETDDSSAFTLPFPLETTAPAPFTTIGTVSVPSGEVASVPWPDLTDDTTYEWRAVVRDETDTSTSATWTLTTPPTPQPAALLTDEFRRTVGGGWGSAPAGQAWATSVPASFSVDGEWGTIAIPKGAGRSIRPVGVRADDAIVEADLRTVTTPGGSGTYATLLARENGSAGYRAKVTLRSTGTTTFALTRSLSGVETTLATTTLASPVRPGTVLRIRFEVTGSAPATLRASAWPMSGTPPTNWQLSATDATAALSGAGGSGLDTYVSSTATTSQTLQVDRFDITRSGTTPPPPGNVAPTARIATPVVDGRTVRFDGSGSSDPDGRVTAWRWSFGDGQGADGATVSRTYAADGTYPVTLTVTDDDGATAQATVSVTVMAPPPVNVAPTARILSPVVEGRTVRLDGSGSSDADGQVVAWRWSYGDGQTGDGATVSRTYAADGTYPVTLTVTDDDGATAQATVSVTVTAPPPPSTSAVQDDFDRTTTSSWGSATTGGPWSLSGATNRFAVTAGTGRQALTAYGTTAESRLDAVALTGSEARVTLAWSRTGAAGKLYASVVPRVVSSSADYRVGVVVGSTGRPTLNLIRRVGGVETTIATATPTMTVAANTPYAVAVRLSPSGSSTVLSAKMWPAGGTEPTAWQVTATDSTAALQTAGSFKLTSYLSSGATAGVTTSFDDLRVTAL